MNSAVPILFAFSVLAQPAMAQDNAEGRTVYQGACAACHGPEGLGDGPMAALLTIPVPDLTGITARNAGVFPWLKVVHVVDGRTGLRGHGGPMPIFGEVFRGDPVAADGPDGTPVITSARVLAVVDYLMSIQTQ
jgi:mono/diheme cytochrome c family protein